VRLFLRENNSHAIAWATVMDKSLVISLSGWNEQRELQVHLGVMDADSDSQQPIFGQLLCDEEKKGG
jgi:hypothetical protein